MKGSYSTTYTPADSLVKLVQALGYLLSLDDNKKMHRVKLIKLLWVADRFHIRKYGRTVSESEYCAMFHGSVCSLALDIAQLSHGGFGLSDDDIGYISEYFTSDERFTAMSKNPGEDYLSETDKEMLSKAYHTFSDADGFDLADRISHKYPEWVQYEPYFNSGKRSSRPIDEIKFFDNPEKDCYFEEDKEILDGAREIFLEKRKLADSIQTDLQ